MREALKGFSQSLLNRINGAIFRAMLWLKAHRADTAVHRSYGIREDYNR
jgi:hypothetical protein